MCFTMLQQCCSLKSDIYGKAKTGLHQLGVSGSATNLVMKIFSQPPHPLLIYFYGLLGLLGLYSYVYGGKE